MSSSKPALTTDKTLFQEILIVMESYNLLFFLKKKCCCFCFFVLNLGYVSTGACISILLELGLEATYWLSVRQPLTEGCWKLNSQ